MTLSHCLAWLQVLGGGRSMGYPYLLLTGLLFLSILVLSFTLVASFSVGFYYEMARKSLPYQFRVPLHQQLKGILYTHTIKVHCLTGWNAVLIYDLWLWRWNKPVIRLGPGNWISLPIQNCQTVEGNGSPKGKQEPSAKIKKQQAKMHSNKQKNPTTVIMVGSCQYLCLCFVPRASLCQIELFHFTQSLSSFPPAS